MVVDFDRNGPAISLPALGEPFAHRLRESRQIDAQPGFEAAVADGQSIVKFGRASEIAHAEIIEPIERHRPPLTGDGHFHAQFSSEHAPRPMLVGVLGIPESDYSIALSAARFIRLRSTYDSALPLENRIRSFSRAFFPRQPAQRQKDQNRVVNLVDGDGDSQSI